MVETKNVIEIKNLSRIYKTGDVQKHFFFNQGRRFCDDNWTEWFRKIDLYASGGDARSTN